MPLECFLYFWCRVFSSMVVCLTVNLTYFCLFLPFHYKPGLNCVILVSAQLTTGIVCLGMKNIFHRRRPGIEVTNRKLLNPVIRLNRERFWSFPSGDSAQAACWAAVVGLSGFYWGWLVFPLTMFARVYYGAHYFLDTLAGTIVGITLGICWHSIWGKMILETDILRIGWDWTMLFALPFCLGLLGYELAMDRRVLYYRNLNEDNTGIGNQLPIDPKKQQEELIVTQKIISKEGEGIGEALALEEVNLQQGEIYVNEPGEASS